MKLENLLMIVVFIALLVVCGMCALTFYETYTWLEVSGARWECVPSQALNNIVVRCSLNLFAISIE